MANILHLLGLEKVEADSFATTIPESVSLISDYTVSDSELSDYAEYPALPSVAKKKKKKEGLEEEHNHQVVDKLLRRTEHIRDTVQTSRSCDSILSECFSFGGDDRGARRRGDMWSTSDGEHGPDYVTVAVEATSICYRDGDVQYEAMCGDHALPFVLGSNFVGVVHECGTEAEEIGIRPGLRVVSIVKRGSSAKFVTVPATNLSIVPKQLDAADVAALISSYLPAFQALHHGQSQVFRQSRDCLMGKKVLVTGGATLEGQAVMRLARLAGAEVYATAPLHHFGILKKLCSVTVLDDDPNEWLPILQEKMDMVVDYEFPRSFYAIRKTLAPNGRLVCLSPKRSLDEMSGWMVGLEEFFERYQLSLIKRASLFDFEENFELHPNEVRSDVKFLLQLLATRQIRPQIDRFIKLSDVPRVYKELQSRPLPGAIICEPWSD